MSLMHPPRNSIRYTIMKNIKITQACLVEGQHQDVGAVLKNVDNQVAADLVHSGRAVVIPEKPEVLGNRDPDPENRDPKPAKKGKEADPSE